MNAAPTSIPTERMSLWNRVMNSLEAMRSQELISLTNERNDNHMVHAVNGDEVTILGIVTSVSFPPVYKTRDGSVIRPDAVLTVDDGTEFVSLTCERGAASKLNGKIVEVSGTVRRATPSKTAIIEDPVIDALPISLKA